MARNLIYWKGRKVDLQASLDNWERYKESSNYYSHKMVLQNCLHYAARKIEQLERQILVRHI